MWLVPKKQVEARISKMNMMLARSFQKVKEDTQNLYQWVQYLHHKNNEQLAVIDAQRQTITKLENQLNSLPQSASEISKLVDNHYKFDAFHQKIEAIHDRIDQLKTQRQSISSTTKAENKTVEKKIDPTLAKIESRLQQIEEKKKATVREKVIARVAKNSKDYVKSLMLSYIRKHHNITGKQLKELIVDDQGLCSKSSFYRILEELEATDAVSAARMGREKYYTAASRRETT